MYFGPKQGDSVHAMDSVELIANKNILPLQTNAGVPTNWFQHQIEDKASVKGQVKFSEQLELL
jgi:hypothetical protein